MATAEVDQKEKRACELQGIPLAQEDGVLKFQNKLPSSFLFSRH
jgi:hypothetical protein